MVEISAPISDYDVFLLIWTPASSVGVFFCKVKISQELVCELKEKSLKINVSLPQVYRIQLHTFEIK